jgi:mercuric ion transport protein
MDKKILTGILASVGASLCCITPVLAVLAGSSSLATTFSWLDPFRPYLIGITILVLAYVWWDKLKPKDKITCDCETEEKISFVRTKKFLSLVTVFAIITISFPYYGDYFIKDENKKEIIIVDAKDIQTYNVNISNMTCPACEATIGNAIHKQDGIVNLDISYKKSIANIKFDTSKTTIEEIKKSIDKTGFITTTHTKL